ncbi:hypothetical protein GCM10010207_67960 [Streptomyces atratus]|nr:hypothetical protein GCM10010207_67960 [Streptomyces atratus]
MPTGWGMRAASRQAPAPGGARGETASEGGDAFAQAGRTPGPADGPDAAPRRRFEVDLRSMTRINLRPIASPVSLGFFTVAIASVMTG